MSNPVFLMELLDNFPLFIELLIPNIFILYHVLKKKIHSFLDPSFMMFLTGSFANTVPFFLFLLKLITLEKFLFFVLAESLFWLGFSCVDNGNQLKLDSSQKSYSSDDLHIIFLVLFVLTVGVTLYNYSTAGIPIFQESRFGFRQNPITAILGRMLSLPRIYLILYTYHILLNHKENRIRRIQTGLCFIVLLCFSFLSGSKGFILSYVWLYFAYIYFYKQSLIHISFKYLILIVLSPIPIIAIYYGSSGINGVYLLLFRFVAAGDGYWQGFVGDVVDKIDNTAAWYERLFSFILGPLGQISQNAKIPIGTLILNQINPGTEGLLEGANSRVPLFTWVCFKWLGLFVSFILGVISRCVAYGNIFCVAYDLVGLTIMFSLYSIALTMITDPTMFGSGLIDTIFGVLIFNLLSLLFFQKRGYIRIIRNN